MRRATLAGILLGLSAGALGAQRLTGTVSEAMSGQPVAGAVVSLTDSAGKALDRTVADRQGRFTLAVPADARLVQVKRIGFLPLNRALPDSARSTTAGIEIVLQRIPAELPPVTVVENGACPPNTTTGQALALWEQA